MKLWLHELGYQFFGEQSLYDLSMPELGALLDGRRTQQAIEQTHQELADEGVSQEQVQHFTEWAEKEGLT